MCTKFVIILTKRNADFYRFFKDENDPKVCAEGQQKMEPFHTTFCPVLQLWKCCVVQSRWVKCKIICVKVRLAVCTVA